VIVPTPLDKWGYNTVAKHVVTPVVLAATMFALAKTTDWPWGWVFSAVHVFAWWGMAAALVLTNRAVLNFRGRPQPGVKAWDRVLLAIYGVDWILMFVVAGLDLRGGWSPPVPAVVHVLGNLLVLAGFALTTWAMTVNRHFEVGVRIQSDRAHAVVDTGPYHWVRHPGYTGVLVSYYLGVPLALGSWPAAAVGALGVVTLIVRTALEDRTLQAELPGYGGFVEKTRYRLVPGIW
jgi:protein-S-isoprenylcysteine O-methyltransferase Ste14